MANSQFTLSGDLKGNLEGMEARVKGAMVAAANYIAPRAEAHMRNTAPWTDRTGNARNGLRAKVVVADDKVAIVLHHSVPYGIYLETRWSGRYAVIEPTMAVMVPELIKTVRRLVF